MGTMFLVAGGFSIPSAYTVLLFLFFVSQGGSGLEKKKACHMKDMVTFFFCIVFQKCYCLFSHPCSAAKVKWGIIWYKLPAEQKQKN